MKTVKIADKKIGKGHPCFIIAEAGSNHNRNLDMAYKLIDVASEAGADAVKFQNFTAEEIYVPNCGPADYLNDPTSVFDIIKSMKMPAGWVPKLADYCEKKKIIFFTTPYDERNVDLVCDHVPCFKVASYEATHLPLIRHIAKKGKPVILSVGVTSIEEIKEAAETIESENNHEIILQHCVGSYPAPCKEYNLRVVNMLQEMFNAPVGVSDHTNDHPSDYAKNPLLIPIASVAIGANTIEKHFTLANNLPGPDHKYALEPEELKSMVRSIRDLEQALGDGVKRIAESEKELYHFAKRSIFSVKDIKKGEYFTRDNIKVLRPGKIKPGLLPKYYENILNKPALRNIDPYSAINLEDIVM